LVRRVIGEEGTMEIKPKIIKEVINPTTARLMTEMMVNATDNGEAKWAKPAGYRIAGKTGTAQIPVAGHYDEEKTIASFVGFAPADDPQFVMLVTLREPTSSPWGSETAAPLWFDIAKEVFDYFGILPG
jgi:cell division protein FtsI/penicillin-binding protein 2